MNERIERLRSSLTEPFLVTNVVNVRYLIGFRSSNAALLVSEDDVRLFADFRYAVAAREVEGVRFVQTKRAIVKDIAGQLSGPIGFEAQSLSYADYEHLAAGDVEPVPQHGRVEALRAVKDDAELAAIRKAAALGDAMFEQLPSERFTGRTEHEVAWRVRELLQAGGAEDVSFPVIVASGPNAARPHTRPGERVIEPGETVIVDAGCVVDGYCSDCTRTFATGELPTRLEEAYAVCLDAQQAALDGVRAGMSGVEADAVARARIAAAGYGDAFGHGLGHGVGIEVHEDPRLSTESADHLQAGNVVTIEPGIYLEGLGGIRIEDLVIVRDDGLEVLSPFTKELQTVA